MIKNDCVTRAIPIIGPIIGGIPIILLAWATKGPGVALAVLGFNPTYRLARISMSFRNPSVAILRV